MIVISALAQENPGIQWQHTIGGSANDFAEFSFKTEGNHIITVGSTNSADGDVTNAQGSTDIWITKFTSSGTLLWKKTIGGNNLDQAVGYISNPDGSFVVVANTQSTSGGISGNHGGQDVLLFKISSEGQILWQKCLGEAARCIVKDDVSGYVLVNFTRSNDGDVSGYHGDRDLWMVKIDESGNIIWQKCFGGMQTDIVNSAAIIQATDKTFWISTETTSTDGDVTGNHGQADVWVLHIDGFGNLITQKAIGGSGTNYFSVLKETSDNRIYIACYTRSIDLPNFHLSGSVINNNGDYTDILVASLRNDGTLNWQKCFGGNNDDMPVSIIADGTSDIIIASDVLGGGGDRTLVRGWKDIWITKITSAGIIGWQKTLGGTKVDGLTGGFSNAFIAQSTGGIQRSIDGGILISGHTDSPNDGDVRGFHTPDSDSSTADIWIIKLSNTGNLLWSKCLGGAKGEWIRGNVVELSATNFIITGHSNSSNFDLSANKGGTDIWVVGLGSINRIVGTTYFDVNLNGIKDSDEKPANGVMITTGNYSYSISTITESGFFILETDTGSYQTKALYPLPYYNIVPATKTTNFTTYFNTDSFSFALQPIPNKQDLVINAVPLTAARPGFTTSYKLFYKNIGTTIIPSGEILFKKDGRLNFISSTPAISSSNGDTLKWNYTNLAPGDTASITINFSVKAPPTVNNGDTLTSIAIISPVTGDETPADDTSTIKHRVTGSFDPNDKYENNRRKIRQEHITNGEYLNYTIRFQNTGTDTAFTVVVRDTLDSKVDATTLQMVAVSHSYRLSIADSTKLTWTFSNINLSDSNINEPLSHGYIAYRIKPKTTLAIGDTVHNTASIFFDYNLPVKTNNAFTTVQRENIILPLKLISFTGKYANEEALLNWTTQGELILKNSLLNAVPMAVIISAWAQNIQPVLPVR